MLLSAAALALLATQSTSWAAASRGSFGPLPPCRHPLDTHATFLPPDDAPPGAACVSPARALRDRQQLREVRCSRQQEAALVQMVYAEMTDASDYTLQADLQDRMNGVWRSLATEAYLAWNGHSGPNTQGKVGSFVILQEPQRNRKERQHGEEDDAPDPLQPLDAIEQYWAMPEHAAYRNLLKANTKERIPGRQRTQITMQACVPKGMNVSHEAASYHVGLLFDIQGAVDGCSEYVQHFVEELALFTAAAADATMTDPEHVCGQQTEERFSFSDEIVSTAVNARNGRLGPDVGCVLNYVDRKGRNAVMGPLWTAIDAAWRDPHGFDVAISDLRKADGLSLSRCVVYWDMMHLD